MKQRIPKVLLCEPSRRWAVLLRRFSPRVIVQEMPSLALLRSALREQSEAFVLLAVNRSNYPDSCSQLLEMQTAHPRVVFCVLLDAEIAMIAPIYFHSGVQFVVTSMQQLPIVLRAARLNARRQRQPRMPWPDQLRARLPWSKND